VLGLRDGANPARWKGHLAELLPKRHKLTRGHHAAMPWADVPAFVAALRDRDGLAPLALEFCILTAARSGEVRGMDWAEVDLDGALWTVPAKRMKAGRLHRVPLSDRAVAILAAVRPMTGGEGLVFPGTKGQPLSDMTLAAVLKRMKLEAVTVHGFRSSFRDWVYEATGHPGDLAEAALAHVAGSAVERAYRRGDALDRRRALMQDWARYLEGGTGGAEVIPLRTARAAS
jgi:integrase